MRRSSKIHAIILAAAIALQTVAAPTAYAAEIMGDPAETVLVGTADDQELPDQGEEPEEQGETEDEQNENETEGDGEEGDEEGTGDENEGAGEDDGENEDAADEASSESSSEDDEAELEEDETEKLTQSILGERGTAVEGRGEILWNVDMSDLSDFDLYTGPNEGVWSAEDGAFRIDGGNGNKAISKQQDFTDFVFEADVTVEKQASTGDTSSAQGGILFRASNGTNRVSDGYYGYYLCLNAKAQEMVLGRSSGNNWNQIATKKMKIEYGQSYHLTVTCAGSHITCYADYNGSNYAKLYINDSTHSQGGIGMRNWISHTSYRNLVVSEYTEETLSENSSYTNPLMNHCADPDVLYHGGTYFLYPTNAGDDSQGIKVYTSTDLVHWTDQGYAFSKGDGWGTGEFWAPDIIERDGVFYMYYVANEQICVATSTSPMGPFKQEVNAPMDASEKNIDAHIFYDEASGKYYIYYVRFTSGNVIWGAELSDDMMSIKKDTLKEIVRADQGWDQDMANVNEGPFMLVHDGRYYLTYSGSHFQSINYGSAYAVSDAPLGDFVKYDYNPIMKSNSTVHGTGHHGIVESPDGSELFMVYHSHHDLNSTEPRQLCIDRIHFTEDADGNTVLEVKGPTITPQALPSGAVDVANYIECPELDEVKAAEDASAADIMAALPAEASIVTSKGLYTAELTWDVLNDADITGEVVTASGSVVLPGEVENLGDLDLSVTCTVYLGDAKLKEKLAKIMQDITIPGKDAVRGNITLIEEKDGAEFTWESDNEEVISSQKVTQDNYYDIPAGVVKRGSTDQTVTLTVTGNLEGVTLSKEIEVKVLAKTEVSTDYEGYLYAHFKEIPGQKGQQDIFYGISDDGLNWTALNDNEAVLKSDVGDKATRDPFIIRSAEGDRFFLIATDQDIYKYGDSVAWDKLSTQGSTALTIWESSDLIHWENERNVDVAGSIGAGCAWAPEAVYDDATGEYLVFWASKLAEDNFARQYTFVSRTRDFYTFTEPELFNDFGSNIDTSVLHEGNNYYRLTKIESDMYVRLDKAVGHPRAYGDQVTQKNIGSLTFNVVGGNYSYIENTAEGCLESFKGNYEGGTLFKFNDRDEWCIMLDEYGGAKRGYIPFVTSDLDETNSIRVLGEEDYAAQEGCKHGVILPVTKSEYDALMAEYGVSKGSFAELEKSQEPVAVYDFETVDGNKAVPATGTDLGLVFNGEAQVKEAEGADGTKSNALYLNGSEGSYGEFTSGIFDGADELTLSFDVKAENAAADSMAVSLGSSEKRYLFARIIDNDTSAGATASGETGIKSVSSSNYGAFGRWLHADVVVKDHLLSFYVDGISVGTVKGRNISELGSDLSMYLGRSFAGAGAFKGSIDNLRIYNRALTQEELGTADPMQIAIKIEAETGVITGVAKAVSRGDASGGYKVGYIDNTDARITLPLKAPKAGTYRIEIAADGDRGAFPNSSHQYWINGNQSDAQVVEYTKSTSWDVWSLYSIYVDLVEGDNTITITHSGRANSFSELDYIIFHVMEDPEYEICLDGKKADTFDPEKSLVKVDVKSLKKLPKVSVKFKEGTDESFKATVVQASEDRPESYVTVYSEKDPSYIKKYIVRFTGPDNFQNLIVNYGADPFVTYHDGYYYYVRMGRNDKGIWVTKAAELSRIASVEPVCVYMPSGDQPTSELWAPEIHYLDGKWYIYYTAGGGSNHRMRVLESVTDDAQGEYVYKGMITPATERWAIDQTVLKLNGKLYAIWSGWDGFVDGEQRLYIAEMENPYTISGDRVELSRPEYAWETNEHPTINEGPQIATAPDGTVNIIYSASGSWSDTYCLGALTLKKGADPMNKDSWIKATKPVFEKNDNTTLSTGHASFVQSPDGTETYIVYHAIVYPGGGWNARGVRAQRVYWNEDGTPFIGEAADYTDRINTPSGTKKPAYTRLEAEDATLTGLSGSSTYNSSAGGCVYGFTNESRKAEFTFDVAKEGDYMLYLGASADVDNAGLKVTINGKEFEKGVYNFNANSGNRLVTDNWFGYEVTAHFTKGSNTVVVTGASDKGTVALDYIEYCELSKAIAPNPGPEEDPEAGEYGEVLPEDIPDDGVIPEGIWLGGVKNLTYDGKKQTQNFRVYDGKKRLVLKTDYTVSYKNNQKAYVIANPENLTKTDTKYAPSIVLTMKGNYSGKKTAYFSINPLSIADNTAFKPYMKKSGKTYKPALTWNGKELKVKTDYTVVTEGDLVTFTGKGNFTGERVLDKSLPVSAAKKISMSKVKVTSIPVQYYTGSAYTASTLKAKDGKTPLELVLTYNKVKLTENVDYKVVKVLNSANVGKATIVLEGLGAGGTEGANANSFVGERRITFTIKAYPMTGSLVRVTDTDGEEDLSAEYKKAGAKPSLKVRFGDTLLKEGRDYTLKYANNTKYPTTKAKVTITGKGNFAGKVTKGFAVTKRLFSEYNGIQVVTTDKAYSKKAGQYATTVKIFDYDGKLLKAGTDYEKKIVYLMNGQELNKKSHPQAGDVITVRVTGRGGYTNDTIETTYKILAAGATTDISKATITIRNQKYDKGNPVYITSQDQLAKAVIGKKKTVITLSTDDGQTGDFMVVPGSYVSNRNKGTAKVTFMGVGDYSGTKTVKFKIGTRSILDIWFGWLGK
ncbi:MAG: family 43 glycosylhydrolase [Butyrivibrio sp.]|nr:family 43 glycosylhydrolase [Butyrivibrio sp.]